MLFPTLEKDWHGKLSGAFSKFFGRYKRVVGIHDDRKVMYVHAMYIRDPEATRIEIKTGFERRVIQLLG